ncbi:MAG: hypothetical protein JWM19_3531 [Actinomycetia bacterium]|nr:hypothetical protein [Actinomycetes bacterium]
MERPRIAVVGSLDTNRTYDPPLRDTALTKQACEQLGQELGAQGCDPVVYSSDPGFVEAEVVSGYIAAGNVRAGSIQIRSRPGKNDIAFNEAAQAPDVFDLYVDPSPDWEVSYHRSLAEVQGILLIGGGRSTLATGLIAISFGIPIIPIGAFGGSTQKVWGEFGRRPNDATDGEVIALGERWRDQSAKMFVTCLAEQVNRRAARLEQDRQAQRRQSRRSVVSLLITALLIVCGLRVGARHRLLLLLLCAGPLLFATAGAIIRNTFDQGTTWLRPATLGLAAGAVSILLFVAAQLATNPNTLQSDGARRLLFFVLPLGFIAGLTFDAVYAKLRTVDAADTDALKPS